MGFNHRSKKTFKLTLHVPKSKKMLLQKISDPLPPPYKYDCARKFPTPISCHSKTKVEISIILFSNFGLKGAGKRWGGEGYKKLKASAV